MKHWLMVLLTLTCFGSVLYAQKASMFSYPVEQGRILYEYSGNTEGLREYHFRDFGKEIALFTNLSRSTTFFAITNTTDENVIEFLKGGDHYHFDLQTKRGLVLKAPIHMLLKYFRISESKPYGEGLESIGAVFLGDEEIIDGYKCEKWSYKGREFWIWKGVLLKMVSKGLNKDFTLKAVEIDFENPVPDSIFVFPKDIPVEKK